ncbi:MAG: hypothetical protein H6502_02035 [Candidatus Woesearchaeota archaeon]|nr:MAG: hypothetical protein H6502_02035 [Candidatus Woesearchaeota archaeon]
MNSKGDLSINIIIIAAIGALLLVVLAVLVVSNLDKFGKNASCPNGRCIDLAGNDFNSCSEVVDIFGNAYAPHPSGSCKVATETCCLKS